MNENMNKEQGPQESPVDQNSWQKTCKMCGHGMYGHGHGHFWLRWLLGIIILAAVFAIGVKVGEFKGGFGRGYHNQGGYNMRYSPFGYPNGMMQYRSGAASPGANITGWPTATTTPAK